jgi:hypothetical protein
MTRVGQFDEVLEAAWHAQAKKAHAWVLGDAEARRWSYFH